MVAYTCNPIYTGSKRRRIVVWGELGQKAWQPIWKTARNLKDLGIGGLGMAQVVGHLPYKHWGLEFRDPSTNKNSDSRALDPGILMPQDWSEVQEFSFILNIPHDNYAYDGGRVLNSAKGHKTINQGSLDWAGEEVVA
jgi:hypothetical protein